jgi:mannobiose 2-epimerase
MMDATELNDFSRRVNDHLFGHILPFWCGPALDREKGGWMAWLSNDLQQDRSKPKGLIVNARILWAFSAVYRARAEKQFEDMAERAFDVVINKFLDPQYGGAFWQLDDSGAMIDGVKKTYGQAFCLYAFSEFYQAFGSSEAMSRAIELSELIERHAHDSLCGGYLEVRQRDWSEAEADARLSEKDMDEKKSMNNHLHVLEAYTNLYRVWKNPLIEHRLRSLIHLFETRILDGRTNHFHHFFNGAWQVRSDTYTFGHDIEGSWLLCEAAEVLGDAALLHKVHGVALRIAETVLNEGTDSDGGLCYEGKAGAILDRGKECWPQAEAVVGYLNAFQLSGDVKYFKSARRTWDFIEEHIMDRVNGEWFWRINDQGQPDAHLPKVSEWKGPYHGTRMCLEALRRLRLLTRKLKTNDI